MRQSTAQMSRFHDLYEQDETAWLDEMSSLIARRQFAEVDAEHLAEYLCDMARRHQRAVENRLELLLVHLLKWEFQPEFRSSSWRSTILEQRRKLRRLLRSGALRRYAHEVFTENYRGAVEQAVAETSLDEKTFPASSPWRLEEILGHDVLLED